MNAAIDPYFIEHGGDFALALPTMLVAPNTRVRLHLQWEVPRVGAVMIDLDGGVDGTDLEAELLGDLGDGHTGAAHLEDAGVAFGDELPGETAH